jgi:AcrR family transcriptional regulator
MGAGKIFLAAATALIAESGGDIARWTVRAIAERAQVGAGLINYHFQTKENLSSSAFSATSEISSRPSSKRRSGAQGTAYLCDVVKNVADFLADNRPFPRFRFRDMKAPGAADNTMKTVNGLVNQQRARTSGK